jgi:hypothetical protein
VPRPRRRLCLSIGLAAVLLIASLASAHQARAVAAHGKRARVHRQAKRHATANRLAHPRRHKCAQRRHTHRQHHKTGPACSRKRSPQSSRTSSANHAPPLVGTPTPAEQPSFVEPPSIAAPPTHFRFFSPTSFFNMPVPTNAPLDPNSAAIMSQFAKEAAEEGPKNELNIDTSAWSIPVYSVPASQPTVRVRENKEVPMPELQSAWEAVPVPSNAQPAQGLDKHLVIWQPSTDKLWEFYQFEWSSTGPQAVWGGAMERTSEQSGVYGPTVRTGAKPKWGASASSLSIAGGLMTLEDLEKGEINHAIALVIPHPSSQYASPANRTDGTNTSPLALPEGAHLRLDPHLDLAALHLPRMVLVMAEAAQRYGIFIRDRGGNIAFYGEDPTPTGTDPYHGPGGYYEGKCACRILESFPWSHLQLLKMELHGG